MPLPTPTRSIINPITTDQGFPEGTSQDGQFSIIPWWTSMRFNYPYGEAITCNADQQAKTVTQGTGDPNPVWSPAYYVGSVFLTQDDILSCPSADPFFGELFQLMDAKLAAQNQPPAPPVPLDNPPFPESQNPAVT